METLRTSPVSTEGGFNKVPWELVLRGVDETCVCVCVDVCVYTCIIILSRAKYPSKCTVVKCEH